MPFPNWRRFHHAFVKAGKWFHPGQILFRVELKHDVPRGCPDIAAIDGRVAPTR
jgi:hypothetical protein